MKYKSSEINFKYRCASLINTNETRRMLCSFGYKLGDFIEPVIKEPVDSDSYCKWLITNSFHIDETDNLNCYDIQYNCGLNKRLFYALSAINDSNDFKQWFTNGQDFILSKYKEFKMDGFHKASPEELIPYFGGEDSMKCYSASAMCVVSTLSEYIEIKRRLSKIGHNVNEMPCDEDWIDEYLDTDKVCFINIFVDYGGELKIEVVDSKDKCKSRYWCFDDHDMFIALAGEKNK